MHNPLALYALLRPHEPPRPRPDRPRRSGSGRRIVVVTALAVVALLVLTVVPAAAAPGWYDKADPVADGGVYPRNDIVRMRFGNVGYVKLRLTTRRSVSPEIDPAWQDPAQSTRIVWLLDIDGDAEPEWRVRMTSTADGPSRARITDLVTGIDSCGAEFNYGPGYGSEVHYVLAFQRHCIDSPTHLAARVWYRYDPPNGPARTDIAPNGGYTPQVVYPRAA